MCVLVRLMRCWECSSSAGEVVEVLYSGFRGAGSVLVELVRSGSALVELVRCWECSCSVC